MPGQATCRPCESRLQRRAHPGLLASFQPIVWAAEELARGISRKSARFYHVGKVP